jgi:hypothetical protein
MLAKYYCSNMVPICRSTKSHSIMPFHQCAIPPMCHSTDVPFHLCAIPFMCHSHSAILPFRHSAILPFLQNAIPPFRHSAIPPIRHYSNIYIHTQFQHSPMSGDAWEYLILLKCSLLDEVEQQNNEDGDYDGVLKNSLSTYWGMFTSGSTEQRFQCTLCKGVTVQHYTFNDLILNFEQSHHVNNHKNNRCTLGEMLTNYSKNQDDILDYECVNCNQRTQAMQRHCICHYPKILCIILRRNRYDRNTKTQSRIQSSVDYLVENFKPNESFGSHEGTDDMIYDLVATINHQPTSKNQGHYTMISQQHDSVIWYKYDDERVNVANLTKNHSGRLYGESSTTKSSFDVILYK